MAQLKSNSTDCIFLGRDGGSITDKTILRALRKIAPGTATTHGFRATFSTWCADTNRDDRVAEMALAHNVKSKVERAYNRSDKFEERRGLAEAWAKHCGAWR
jgi:integrase